MRYHAIAMILLMIGAALAGCTADEGSSSDNVDDTVENIGGTSNETINQTTNDTAGNETTDGGNGTTNNTVQYVGFLDNSSIWGYKINPIENFSRIYVAMNEENCTSTSEGDDFLGIWNDPLCVTDYGQMAENVTYSNEELCLEEGGSSWCFNMTISGRVMWFDGEFGGGEENSCQVFIQSEQFIPSSSYILSLNTISSGAPDWEYIPVDWDQLWADPAYIAWDAERMAAYNDEVSSQPAWCTDPIFDALSWTS